MQHAVPRRPTWAAGHTPYLEAAASSRDLYLRGLRELYVRYGGELDEAEERGEALGLVLARVRGLLDLLARSVFESARVGLAVEHVEPGTASPSSAPTSPPPRTALLTPVMKRYLPIERRMEELRAQLREVRSARRRSLLEQELRVWELSLVKLEPYFRSYDCIEVDPSNWPTGVTKKMLRKTKKAGGDVYYYNVQLAGKKRRGIECIVEQAHRLVCWAVHGPPAEGEQRESNTGVVMHLCHNPRCINARHLQYGTKLENHREHNDTPPRARQKTTGKKRKK